MTVRANTFDLAWHGRSLADFQQLLREESHAVRVFTNYFISRKLESCKNHFYPVCIPVNKPSKA